MIEQQQRGAAVSWYVHITRAEHWEAAEQQPISREEWLAYVESDEAMRRITAAEIEESKPFANADAAAWVERFADGSERILAWFGYHKGLIEVRSPDSCTIQKMAEVAEDLNANVVDENDNLLVDPGRPGGDTDDGAWRAASPAFQPPEPPPSWETRTARRIFGAFIFAGVAFVIGGLGLIFFLLLRDWWER